MTAKKVGKGKGKGQRIRQWKPAFLKELRKVGNVSRAAAVARISRKSAYAARDKDDEFREAWDEAVNKVADTMEAEVYRRAVTGTLKPVFFQGKQCGAIREFSDILLMFRLKALRPQEYRERVSVDNGLNLTAEDLKLLTTAELDEALSNKLSPAQIQTLIAARRALPLGAAK